MEKNAIIIGCGIAGPALALQLKRAGIKSTIYEAEKIPSTLGLSIYLSPNGMNVIRSLGLYDKIKKLGTETHITIFYNEKGKQLGAFDYTNEEKLATGYLSQCKDSLLLIFLCGSLKW